MVAVGLSIVLKQRAAAKTCVCQRRPHLSEACATAEVVVNDVIVGDDWCGVEVISVSIRSADAGRRMDTSGI
eukprot:6516203-Prymnesium_polylepis.1